MNLQELKLRLRLALYYRRKFLKEEIKNTIFWDFDDDSHVRSLRAKLGWIKRRLR